MPNTIKYSTTGDTLSLRKGNWFIGVGDTGKGPTSTTGHWAAIVPSSGGYTIYENKASNGPSIRVPADDNDLVRWAQTFYGGSNISTAYSAITYLNSNTTTMVVNREYENITTNGLIFSVDAGFTTSYYTSGSTWNDISLSGATATLYNTPSFSGSSGGFLRFSKSSSQYATSTNIGNLSNWTAEAWVRFNSSLTNQVAMVIGNQYNGSNAINFTIGTNGAPTSYNIQSGFFDGTWRNTTGFTPSLDTWYHIVGTYDGSTIRQYVNGNASGGTLNYVGTPTSGGEIRMMRRWDDAVSSGNLFDGDLAIVRIYNRAITSGEVLQNYNAQVSRFSASYDSDAQAFFTAAGITDTTQKNAVNQLVLDLKSYSLWNKMNAIYPFVGGTATTHKYNLKDSRDLNAAYRLSFAGGWTHSSNGVTPNGVNGYADTYFDGNVGAIGCYNRNTGFAMGTKYDEWEGGDYPVYSIPWIYLLGRGGTIQNTVDQQNTVNPAGASLPFAHITYDTQQRLYTNGNLVKSNAFYTSAPSAPTGYPIWIGGLNDNGRFNGPTYYGGTSSFSFISGTLNSTESANLNTAVQAFQTTLGRNV